MRTEREKMLAGEVYDACDPDLLEDLNRVKVLCQQYNNLLPTDFAARNKMIREILGQADEDTFINQPFYCDYGKHIPSANVSSRTSALPSWTRRMSPSAIIVP